MYQLKFVSPALKEWYKLDGSIKKRLKKKLIERLSVPRIKGAELHRELSNCYKIKLRNSGYRLIYEVDDAEKVVLVLSINKRDDLLAYTLAGRRKK